MADMTDDIRDALEKQIADLKTEMAGLRKSVASRVNDAEDTFVEVKDRAKDAAHHMRHKAHAAADTIRDNPGTSATVLSATVILGFLAGLVVAGMREPGSHHRR
ncbi:hypothetical protein [Paenirhodobacter populi]|uniref:DUF3618 domain-containing protein n=1 Tax=Paenirhodobacter populi TaxID=2306993 RepID=A0A443JLH5_9RHOB|nr:hypothetical protein [Sinirhodobacter populi]RWR21402.1 hypothetical protein D2T30_08640 [Sinirhodobacter populi]